MALNNLVEDWDFKGVDTKYITHGIHYYPARMIPQIANRLILSYSDENDVVLDPFCGSGTVLLESKLLKRSAIGIDINPLAILISKVKSRQLNNLNYDFLESFLEKIKKSKYSKVMEIFLPEFKNLSYWFTKKSIQDLLIIKYNLKNLKILQSKLDFLLLCFSKTINDVSKGKFDGSSTHLRKNLKNFLPNTIEIFEKNLKNQFEMFKDFNEMKEFSNAWVIPGDSRFITLRNDSIDCIITSPPYGEEENTIGYMRWTKFSLYWLDFSPLELLKYKKRVLGTVLKNAEYYSSKLLNNFITNLDISQKRISYLNSFYKDYLLCFKELFRVLKSKKYCCIVIGNRTISKKPLFMDELTLEIADKVGFKHINTFYREIPTKTIPWSGISGKTIKKENIIILRKT